MREAGSGRRAERRLWDGSSWSALGSGLSDTTGFSQATALAVSGGNLYVGGVFTIAGNSVSAYVAEAILAPEPPTLSIAPDGYGRYLLNALGQPNFTYQLQRAPNLAGP